MATTKKATDIAKKIETPKKKIAAKKAIASKIKKITAVRDLKDNLKFSIHFMCSGNATEQKLMVESNIQNHEFAAAILESIFEQNYDIATIFSYAVVNFMYSKGGRKSINELVQIIEEGQ
jgi:hypothetical protein